MKFKIKYSDQIVGLFIIIAFASFAALIVMLGAKQRWFSKDYKFETLFKSASGISPGSNILLKGFVIGKIDKLTLNKNNEVEAKFHIYDSFYNKVRGYSILELTVSPIGLGTQLLFHPGSGDELMPEGSFIPLADSDEGQALLDQNLVTIPPKDDTITRLLSNINPMIENTSKTLVTLNRTLTEVNRAIAGQSTGVLGTMLLDAGSAVGQLPGTMEDVRGMTQDIRENISQLLQETSSLISEFNSIAANLNETTASIKDPTGLVTKLLDPKGSIKKFLDDDEALYKKISSMINELDKSAKSLQSIVTSLNSEMPKVASLLNETKTAIAKAQDVLEGLKNNPLIKGGIPERLELEPLRQSMREGSFE